MTNVTLENRASIIGAVTTPLAFIVLGMLILDGSMASLAVPFPDYRGPLIWTLIISLPAYIATVVLLAIFRPEALTGARPWQETYASHFADDIYIGLDGALNNLEKIERIEAWLTVSEVISTSTMKDRYYTEFCKGVASRIKDHAKLQNRTFSARGAIERST